MYLVYILFSISMYIGGLLVLIAHWRQVCTGLPTYCAHLVKQQLKDVYTGSSSVLTVCSKCALQCAQAVMLLCTLSLAVYTKSKTDEHT